ncbi:TonB-dependent receptor [Thalassotalea sp. LPB0316]|uniref:TonB-dependent receptor n=1 Tax=Thalassotalea sp. LPB0316 TaxID=2769490 RepID=UPI001868D927|nr:TonB-dependent receptor [Thalassotalea sp. LPB0316]QOL24585.1 TonB-dependent receptor [Thalassotalea sp. LPB0316]
MLKTRKFSPICLAVSTALACTSYSAMSIAQQNEGAEKEVEVIVVKGAKRPKTLQEVSASVNVIGGEEMAQMKIERLDDLSSSLPNVSISANAIQDTISMRGINSDLQAGGEQSVGIFVDGIFHGRGIQSRFSFLDVETVEVLRGPQGALFGKNTIAGVISINPAQAREDFEGSVTVGYETQQQQIETRGYITGALSDDGSVKGRLAFKYNDNDKGLMKNAIDNSTGSIQTDMAIRGMLDWEVNDALSFNFRAEQGVQEQQGIWWELATLAGPLAPVIESLGEDGTVNHIGTGSQMGYPGLSYKGEEVALFDANFSEYAFKTNYNTDAGTFTFIAAQSNYDFDRTLDADFGPLPIIHFSDFEDYEQTSLEARFVSQDNDSFEYLFGVYYQDSDLVAEGITDTATNQTSAVGGAFFGALGFFPEHHVTSRYAVLDQNSETLAIFGQVGIGLTENLKLELSGRYSEEDKTATQAVSLFGGVGNGTRDGLPITNPIENYFWSIAVLEATPHANDLERNESHFSPNVNLNWTLNQDTNLYVSYSKGFKGGGFNSFAMSADPAEAEYEDEEATSFEVGGKFVLAEGAATLNAAIFDTDYDNMQTTQFTGGTTFIVSNAAQATSQGLELDLTWLVSDDWTVYSTFGYIDFEFVSYENAGCTALQVVEGGYANAAACAAAGGNDLSGKTNQDVPKFTASVGLEYMTTVGEYDLISRLNLNHSDDFFAAPDLDPESKVDAFTLVDLSMRLASPDGDWDVAFIARNLTDEKYFYYHNDTPLLTGSHQVATMPSSTYTLQFSYHFMD